MWIHLNDSQIQEVVRALDYHVDEFDHAEAKKVLEAIQEQVARHKPADPYRDYLKEKADDEMEVDDDAVVSPGSDPGSWVHAWIWVTDKQAGLFTCEECSSVFSRDRLMSGDCDVCDECGKADDDEPERCDSCGEPLDEAGDGYDGKCADCADKVAQCENCGNTDNDGSDICPDCKGAMSS